MRSGCSMDHPSRYLKLAAEREILITRHGRRAGVLIGLETEDDWFEYRSENHPEFSGARDRFPVPQPLCDQLGATPIVASVQDAQVLRIGAQVDAGRPRVDLRVTVGTRGEVPGRAIDGLDSDLARPVQLRRVRVPGPLSVPVVEDAGGGLPL